MTAEELEILVEQQTKTIADLEAERNSLKAENEKLVKTDQDRAEELRKTKELNFTLSRQMGRASDQKSVEEIINDMF